MDLSKAIRVLMEENEVSSGEIEKSTGWSSGYIASCRSGAANPERRLIGWAEVLKVTPTELVSRAESYPDSVRRAVA